MAWRLCVCAARRPTVVLSDRFELALLLLVQTIVALEAERRSATQRQAEHS